MDLLPYLEALQFLVRVAIPVNNLHLLHYSTLTGLPSTFREGEGGKERREERGERREGGEGGED